MIVVIYLAATVLVPGEVHDVELPDGAARPVQLAIEVLAGRLGLALEAVEKRVERVSFAAGIVGATSWQGRAG